MDGPQQIAIVGRESGEILEQGQHSSITADEAEAFYVELECEECGQVGTYQGNLVSEGNKRFHTNWEDNCTQCGHPLRASVDLQEDPTEGGLNVVDFEPPEGGTYNHDPYMANKIEGVDEEGTPTGR